MTAEFSSHLGVEHVDGVTIVRFVGRVISKVFGECDGVSAVAEELLGLVEGGSARLLLDLGGLDYLGGEMIRELLRLKRRVDAGGGRLVLCGLAATPVRDVFRIARLDRFFEITPDVHTGLDRF
jgi:anti-anti-sigma factor